MSTRNTLIAFSLLFSGLIAVPAWAEDGDAFPEGATFKTLVTTTDGIEGLTNDNKGFLYTPARPAAGNVCPVWRFDSNESTPTQVVVGTIPAPCLPLGLAFDHAGRLYVADPNSGTIFRFFPNAATPPALPPVAAVYAT
ncbi:MAG: hypothetical protein ACRET6_00120, partial [Burkholderiales bacterium]